MIAEISIHSGFALFPFTHFSFLLDYGGLSGPSLFSDLWSQVVLEHAELIDLELDNEGLLVVEAQSGEIGEGGGFIEQI